MLEETFTVLLGSVWVAQHQLEKNQRNTQKPDLGLVREHQNENHNENSLTTVKGKKVSKRGKTTFIILHLL